MVETPTEPSTKAVSRRLARSKDLRKGRISLSGQAYLVTTVTAGRAPLFADLYLARIVVNALRYQHDHGHVNSLAFVVMPDHLHWLFELRLGQELSRVVGVMKRYSSASVNRLLGRTGVAVWQQGFHDHGVRGDEDLRALARYVVLNPIRAGLVERLGQYPHWDACWL